MRDLASLTYGKIIINARFNNIHVAVTQTNGDVICQSSAGSVGFKGKKKATIYAAQKVIEELLNSPKLKNMKTVDIEVKGPGGQRDSAITSILRSDLIVKGISDVSRMPHNGVRPPKRRRV